MPKRFSVGLPGEDQRLKILKLVRQRRLLSCPILTIFPLSDAQGHKAYPCI